MIQYVCGVAWNRYGQIFHATHMGKYTVSVRYALNISYEWKIWSLRTLYEILRKVRLQWVFLVIELWHTKFPHDFLHIEQYCKSYNWCSTDIIPPWNQFRCSLLRVYKVYQPYKKKLQGKQENYYWENYSCEKKKKISIYKEGFFVE